MGSTIRGMMRKVARVAVAVCMVVSLNPAAAFADESASVGDPKVFQGASDSGMEAYTDISVVAKEGQGPVVTKDVLRAPNPSAPGSETDFLAEVTGEFKDPSSLKAFEVAAGSSEHLAFLQEADGSAVGPMTKLAIASDADDPIISLSSVSLRIDDSVRAKLGSQDPVCVLGMQDGKVVRHQAHITGLPEGDPSCWYVTFTDDLGDSPGTYAVLIPADAADGRASVEAVAAGEGGRVMPSGKTEYILGGASDTARYTFLPYDGHILSKVELDGAAVYDAGAGIDRLTGMNFLDIALRDGDAHKLTASFEKAQGSTDEVRLRASAFPASSDVSGAPSAISAGDATVPWAGASSFAECAVTAGRAVSASIAGEGIKPVRAYVAPLGAPDDSPLWREVSLVGQGFRFPSLLQDTGIRFAYDDGDIADLPEVSVKGAICSDEEPPQVIAQTAEDGTASAEGGSIRVLNAHPKLGGTVSISIAPDEGSQWQLKSVEVLTRDAAGQVTSRADMTGQVASGTLTMGSTVSDTEIRVVFEKYDSYFIHTARGGRADASSMRITRTSGPAVVHLEANEGYVVDEAKTKLANGEREVGITLQDGGKRAIVSIPFAGGVSQILKAAFKKAPAADDDEYVDVEVDVEVKVEVSRAARTVRAAADSEEKGGVVSPAHVTLRKGSAYTFNIFPDEGYDVESITYSSASTGDILGTAEKEDLALITDGTLSGQGPSGKAFGYALKVESVPGSIDMSVVFAKAEGRSWGDTGRVVIDDDGQGGIVSPKGELVVPQGYTVQTGLLVRPAQNHHLEHLWLTHVSGEKVDMASQVDADGNVTLGLVAGDRVHAQFAADTIKVHVDQDVQGGAISPAGTLDVLKEGPLELFFEGADANSCLKSVIVRYPDGAGGFEEYEYEVPAGTYRYAVDDLEDGMQVSAVFGQGKRPEPAGGVFSVRASATGPGSISPAGDMRMAAGMRPTFMFMPDADAQVSEVRIWQGDAEDPSEVIAGADAQGWYAFGPLDSDVRIEVAFTKAAYHTIRLSCATEGGSIDADGAVEGVLSVLDGQEVSISVVPDAGYEVKSVRYEPAQARAFAALLGDGGRDLQVDAKGGQVAFTATEDASIIASFAKKGSTGPATPGSTDPDDGYDFHITASAGEHGRIEPAGRIGVDRGADAVFDLKPDAGYRVAYVEVDGKRIVGARSQWEFADVAADHTIRVQFEPNVLREPAKPRLLRQLQSLASTGDARAIGVLALAVLACAAAGVALLSSAKGRARGRRDAHRRMRG